jgi:hypothetical protein
MSTLFEQREAAAKQVFPYVVASLEEFAKKKWAGGCLPGGSAKFRIYYQNDIGFFPDHGSFSWTVCPEKGKKIKGTDGFNYPTYSVRLYFGEDGYDTSTQPVGFTVNYQHIELTEVALREALTKLLSENQPARDKPSWHFDEEGTARLK